MNAANICNGVAVDSTNDITPTHYENNEGGNQEGWSSAAAGLSQCMK